MNRVLCVGVVVLSLFCVGTTGCSQKKDNQPNPELQVPEVPPGRGAKGGGMPQLDKGGKEKKDGVKAG